MLKLRPYQQQIIDAVKADWQKYTDVLVTAATGSGKTLIFLQLLIDLLTDNDKRALILAHRQELIFQPLERIQQYWPDWFLRSGIVMADNDDCSKRITVATVQTLQSEKRLRQLLAFGPIDYLITDETHHATADSYVKVYETLKDVKPNMRHLGVTATPIRADGAGLVQVFQKESAHFGIRELVKMGYLAPPRWLAIQTGISLKGVTSHSGDYSAKRLADVYDTKNCFDLVVESHRKYADGRQCLAFTASVAGAYCLAEKFNEAGITAVAADATTDKRERHEILRDFRNGKVQVLCNMGLFTEGLDVPQVSCIHQVRPTKSDALYTQMIGRALRIVPGKEDALILDYAPVESRNVVMMGDVLGVDARKDVYVKESEEVGEVVGGMTFDGSVKWLSGDPMEIISRQMDYLSLSPFSWHKASDGWMSIGLGKASDDIERSLLMSPPGESMTLYLVAKRPGEGNRAYLVQEGDIESLSDWAEGYIEERGQAILAQKAKRWRREAATDAQIRFARRLGITEFESKGQVAEAITHKLAMKALESMA